MATTLAQEAMRADDGAFRALVRSALFRLIPDVIGENTGTAAQIAKRHAWAQGVLSAPDYWVTRAALMVAGEPAIRAVDMPALPSDAVILARVTALVNDMAGCTAADAV